MFQATDQDWTKLYLEATGELPPHMPPPKGKGSRSTCNIDADRAHDVVTRRSVSGVLLFFNNMPVNKWISKRQKMVESSSYGSELVAARVAIELIIEFRYKVRMLGVPVTETALMLGDNMSIIINTTIPSSQLKKKHNAIAYHRVCEAIAGKSSSLSIFQVRKMSPMWSQSHYPTNNFSGLYGTCYSGSHYLENHHQMLNPERRV
jgi:hypothetical protein